MISRKNDGTVKMTGQRATSMPWTRGMTGNGRTLAGYLQTAGKKTPREVVARRLEALSQSEQVGSCITFLKRRNRTYFLCHCGSTHWWVKTQADGTWKSRRYADRRWAMYFFERSRITWFEFHPPGQEVDHCALPKKS
jgi:hypothetical protein